MSARADAIAAVYAQVRAPQWAARNLDALADVLRDLSWLPEGPVTVALPGDVDTEVAAVVHRAARESAAGPRAVCVEPGGTSHTG